MRLMKEGPEATITELRREKISLEERAFNLNREIEKLRDYLNSSVEEVEEWRGRYSELESLRAQEISELRKQFENFRKANVVRRKLYSIQLINNFSKGFEGDPSQVCSRKNSI